MVVHIGRAKARQETLLRMKSIARLCFFFGVLVFISAAGWRVLVSVAAVLLLPGNPPISHVHPCTEYDTCVLASWISVCRASRGGNPIVMTWRDSIPDPFKIAHVD
jgi:hypothetical protein